MKANAESEAADDGEKIEIDVGKFQGRWEYILWDKLAEAVASKEDADKLIAALNAKFNGAEGGGKKKKKKWEQQGDDCCGFGGMFGMGGLGMMGMGMGM